MSSIFKRYEENLIIEKDKSDHSGAEEEDSVSLSYEVTHTHGNGATFNLYTSFNSSFRFPIEWGEVTLEASFMGFPVGRVTHDLNIQPGPNALTVALEIFGQDVLAGPCTSTSIVNPKFCIANELIRQVINRDTVPDGIILDLVLTMTSIYGDPLTFRLDSVLFQQDPDFPPEFERYESLGLIPDFGVELGDTAWGLISGIGSSSWEATAWIAIHNIFNFTLEAHSLKLDLVLKDWDGVPDVWYLRLFDVPQPPDLSYMLVNDISKTMTNFLVPVDEDRRVELEAGITWSSVSESMLRLYDDVFLKDRLCIHMRDAAVTLTVRGQEGEPPLTYTQEFDLDDQTLIGDYDCSVPSDCTPETHMLWSHGFNTGQFHTVSPATISGSTARIAHEGGNKGALWTWDRQYLLSSWESRFEFRVLEETNFLGIPYPHGDGLVFVVQNVGTNAIGAGCSGTESGMCHGYRGMGSSVGVMFDAYANNEIAVYANGDEEAMLSYSNDIDEIDDDDWHEARVFYHSGTKKLTVTFADKVLVADIPMETLGLSDGYGYIGFTASTRSLARSTISVRNWSFREVKTDVGNTQVLEEGRIRGRVGSTGTFTIVARDSCGEKQRQGGTSIVCVLQQNGVNYPVSNVLDEDNGEYTVTFSPSTDGTFNVHIQLPEHGGSGVIGTIKIEPA